MECAELAYWMAALMADLLVALADVMAELSVLLTVDT